MFSSKKISYEATGSFSTIVKDYLAGEKELRKFYVHDVNHEGIASAIAARKNFNTDRELLVSVLKDQYQELNRYELVETNINLLKDNETFTICTAHQPNLCTGPLYFIFKILHAIRLAQYLKEELPGYNFVPVYYMGSEDADLEELNNFSVAGKIYTWNTNQKGAVGRMKVDKELTSVLNELEQQIATGEHGREIIDCLKKMYSPRLTIAKSTFELVHTLFGKYGLIVLNADDAALKKQMIGIFEEELLQHTASSVVNETCTSLGSSYNIQAHPREINLFYLKDDTRERIEKVNGDYVVVNTDLRFSEKEIIEQLRDHPELFSPNVILRAVYQEKILPNIAFVGGGGELAYWLQLKDLFSNYNVPFPVLVLRNSFLIADSSVMEKIEKTGISIEDVFKTENELVEMVVKKLSPHEISLNGSLEKAEDLFNGIQQQAGNIDPTLSTHVLSLQKRFLDTMKELEKKMLRAEKRKYSDKKRQVRSIKDKLFPGNGLQERKVNFLEYYSKWGPEFIDALLEHSPALEQEFTLLIETKDQKN
jgi:bacillithiol synthase